MFRSKYLPQCSDSLSSKTLNNEAASSSRMWDLPFETASYPIRYKYLSKLTMQHTSQDEHVVTISPPGCRDYTSREYIYKPTFQRNLVSRFAVSLNVAKHQLQGIIIEGRRHCENLKSQNCYSSSILKGIHIHIHIHTHTHTQGNPNLSPKPARSTLGVFK